MPQSTGHFCGIALRDAKRETAAKGESDKKRRAARLFRNVLHRGEHLVDKRSKEKPFIEMVRCAVVTEIQPENFIAVRKKIFPRMHYIRRARASLPSMQNNDTPFRRTIAMPRQKTLQPHTAARVDDDLFFALEHTLAAAVTQAAAVQHGLQQRAAQVQWRFKVVVQVHRLHFPSGARPFMDCLQQPPRLHGIADEC